MNISPCPGRPVWFLSLQRGLPGAIFLLATAGSWAQPLKRPNILIAISDDQSWVHNSAAGFPEIKTPAFDRVAKSGVIMSNAICGSPGCSPSRAALLTGLHAWSLQEAGTHASSFPAQYPTYPQLLEQAGYYVGYTGKGWAPGNWKISGRTENPAGPIYSDLKVTSRPTAWVSQNDYSANFEKFLAAKPKDEPFCFWYGGEEPHRPYEKGSAARMGKNIDRIKVPGFLPNDAEVRSDIADYLLEIEYFDSHLAKILKLLDEKGELENTLVIVTSDNGMPFPRSKANCYEYGIHEPMAISWPGHIPPGRTVPNLVGFVDLTATILDASGTKYAPLDATLQPVGKSFLALLEAKAGEKVDYPVPYAYSTRERHSSARPDNLGYPQRSVRSDHYLYILNLAPERWPAGNPQAYDENGKLGAMYGAFFDIDAGPSLTWITSHHNDPRILPFFDGALAKRGGVELYDIISDPSCLHNLAGLAAYEKVEQPLASALANERRRTRDTRLGPHPEIWESYPRFEGKMRKFPEGQ